jgi:hypothetical protein
MKKISILNLAEDLLESDPIKESSQVQSTQLKRVMSKKAPVTKTKSIETLIFDLAQALAIYPQELTDWIAEYSVPKELVRPILSTSQRLGLNPLMGHIAWEFTPKGDWEIYIPIDGWIALIHREPKFQGITFDQSSQTENGITTWMECSIYRSDLAHPITVREYFAELKTDHPIWGQMPYRMLRHKTLQQCARLAFGISVLGLKSPNPSEDLSKKEMHSQNGNALNAKKNLKEKLNSRSTHAR